VLSHAVREYLDVRQRPDDLMRDRLIARVLGIGLPRLPDHVSSYRDT